MSFSNFTAPSSDRRLSANARPFFGKHSSPASSLADFFRCFCGKLYLQSERTSVPLSDYVKMIATTWTVTIPGHPNTQLPVLTEEVQQLMRRMLAHLPDPQTNTMCFFELKAANVRVDLRTKQPFLHDVSWTPNYDGNLAQMNYARVGEIFRDTIFNGEFDSLPQDFQALLELMKNMGHMSSYAIQHHCSLVWAIDKKDLFARIYDYSHDILRKENPELYEQVMNNMAFPPNWDNRVQQNTYLGMFYNRSWNEYEPLSPNAVKEVLRFKRNTYSHSLQHAWDKTAKKQMYNQADLGEMMETALPLVLHRFQLELDKRGLLRLTLLESLFL